MKISIKFNFKKITGPFEIRTFENQHIPNFQKLIVTVL